MNPTNEASLLLSRIFFLCSCIVPFDASMASGLGVSLDSRMSKMHALSKYKSNCSQ